MHSCCYAKNKMEIAERNLKCIDIMKKYRIFIEWMNQYCKKVNVPQIVLLMK